MIGLSFILSVAIGGVAVVALYILVIAALER